LVNFSNSIYIITKTATIKVAVCIISSHIKQIIHDGSQRARNVAKETMAEVREAMGIIY
jgi:hypothetical protein